MRGLDERILRTARHSTMKLSGSLDLNFTFFFFFVYILLFFIRFKPALHRFFYVVVVVVNKKDNAFTCTESKFAYLFRSLLDVSFSSLHSVKQYKRKHPSYLPSPLHPLPPSLPLPLPMILDRSLCKCNTFLLFLLLRLSFG